MSRSIVVFAEVRDGQLKRTALEATTAAAGLKGALGARVVAVVFAPAPSADFARLGKFGADEVLTVLGDAYAKPAACTVARTLAEIATQKDAALVLLAASASGKDAAPRLSALLKAPLFSDCVGLSAVDGRVEARRPVYAGKAFWNVRALGDRTLATLRPNVFTARESGGGDAPVAAFTPANTRVPRTVLKQVIEPQGGKKIELTEANVIVSGGRGMKGPENYPILETLAGVIGGAVGASRAAVDAGWRPHGDQVGQTGKTVSPSLYIACGISGAIQHLAGMSSSRVIVAINKDPEAPIFKLATYGIVGDLFEVVPALTEELKKQKH